MMNDLLPCPCCGGEAVLEEYSTGFTVWCTECDMGLRHKDWTKEKAKNLWNTRLTK